MRERLSVLIDQLFDERRDPPDTYPRTATANRTACATTEVDLNSNSVNSIPE